MSRTFSGFHPLRFCGSFDAREIAELASFCGSRPRNKICWGWESSMITMSEGRS